MVYFGMQSVSMGYIAKATDFVIAVYYHGVISVYGNGSIHIDSDLTTPTGLAIGTKKALRLNNPPALLADLTGYTANISLEGNGVGFFAAMLTLKLYTGSGVLAFEQESPIHLHGVMATSLAFTMDLERVEDPRPATPEGILGGLPLLRNLGKAIPPAWRKR
jgi:hypothetical protein